ISSAPIPEDETLREPARLGSRNSRARDNRRRPLPVPDSGAMAEERGAAANDRRDAHAPDVTAGKDDPAVVSRAGRDSRGGRRIGLGSLPSGFGFVRPGPSASSIGSNDRADVR